MNTTKKIDSEKLYWASFNRFEMRLPGQCVLDCSHSGDCMDDVTAWEEKIRAQIAADNFTNKPTPDKIRAELKEYGAWDETELADDAANFRRLIWSAANNIAGELYRQERAEVRIVQRDFLTVTRGELGEFDAVVMNPPFHLRADIRHILHARQFLKPGGTLAALCLDTPHREAALKPLAATWEKLPAGIFGKEGTNVSTILLTIQN